MEAFLDHAPEAYIVQRLWTLENCTNNYITEMNLNLDMHKMGTIKADRYSEFIPKMQEFIDNIENIMRDKLANDITAKVAYDILFTYLDAVPMLVELDNYNEQLGEAIVHKRTGERFSDWVANMVKV